GNFAHKSSPHASVTLIEFALTPLWFGRLANCFRSRNSARGAIDRLVSVSSTGGEEPTIPSKLMEKSFSIFAPETFQTLNDVVRITAARVIHVHMGDGHRPFAGSFP